MESWHLLNCNLLATWHRGHQAALAYRGLEGSAFLGLLFLQQKTVLSGLPEGVKADPFNVPLFSLQH